MARKKNPIGRPPIKVDWKTVDKLLFIQATGEEIAGFLGYSYDTIERKCKAKFNKSFAEYSKEKRGHGKISLRRRQWQQMEKNPTMAIWLGKQYLKQTDKHEADVINHIVVDIE